MQISSLKEEIQRYKHEVDKVSQTALTFQESSKNIAHGSDVEVKGLKAKLR
jgi:archaellum component FlaC